MEHSKRIHWLIVTDLDGTLLDHHSYSFAAARITLEKLQSHGIPVIINTSKTASEAEKIRDVLPNHHPFIVENGSGILIPKTYFSEQPDTADTWKNYWEIVLGKPRSELLAALNTIPDNFKRYYRNYQTLSVDDIMDMTGLSRDDALSSLDRRYTEPLQWLGDSTQKHTFFWQLHKKHIHFTEGGRFIHLMGHTNKGSATAWLSRCYQKEYNTKIKIVALGDGNNDIDMMKAADIAVVIRSPAHKLPTFDHNCKIISEQTGPEGWAEAIETLFFKHTELQV